MKGLENVKNKKVRFFKLDNRTEMKNFIHNPVNALLIMGRDLERAFLIAFDGSTKMPAKFKTPSHDYVYNAPHALIKNELFIFGVYTDDRKVRKFYEP